MKNNIENFRKIPDADEPGPHRIRWWNGNTGRNGEYVPSKHAIVAEYATWHETVDALEQLERLCNIGEVHIVSNHG